MNAALSWASAAANDQDIRYTGVRYDGARHDYEGTVEEFFDTVGEKREWLDWELQRNRIVRQQAEVAAEVALAQTREQQAQVRFEVQELNVVLQEKRLQASRKCWSTPGASVRRGPVVPARRAIAGSGARLPRLRDLRGAADGTCL